MGWVPGVPDAGGQGRTLDESEAKPREVIELLREDGEVAAESEFVGVRRNPRRMSMARPRPTRPRHAAGCRPPGRVRQWAPWLTGTGRRCGPP